MDTENIQLPTFEQLDGNVELNADQRAVLMKSLKEQMFGFSHLYSNLEKGEEISKSVVKSILYLGDARIAEASKIVGIELDSNKEREERYARIRGLNERIRELEIELGKSGTVSQTQAHLKLLAEEVDSWWGKEGLGYVRELSFKKNGAIEAELSCVVSGDYSILYSDTPVTDKENKSLWVERLKEAGLVLAQISSREDFDVVDCDKSQSVLNTWVTSRFPSARILSTTNHKDWRTGVMILRSLKVYIANPEDVLRKIA